MSLKSLPKLKKHQLSLFVRFSFGLIILFLGFLPHDVEAFININRENKAEIIRLRYQYYYAQRRPIVPTKPPQINYTLKQNVVVRTNISETTTTNQQPTPTPQQNQPISTQNPTQTPTETPTQAPQPTQTPVNSNINASQIDLLNALNAYRQKNGVAALSWDNNLGSFAQSRAEYFVKIGGMDNHAGFNEYVNNDGFRKLGFLSLGENSSYGYDYSASDLIEKAYGTSSGHNANQLNPNYTHVGIGVSGKATNFIFGGKKI